MSKGAVKMGTKQMMKSFNTSCKWGVNDTRDIDVSALN